MGKEKAMVIQESTRTTVTINCRGASAGIAVSARRGCKLTGSSF